MYLLTLLNKLKRFLFDSLTLLEEEVTEPAVLTWFVDPLKLFPDRPDVVGPVAGEGAYTPEAWKKRVIDWFQESSHHPRRILKRTRWWVWVAFGDSMGGFSDKLIEDAQCIFLEKIQFDWYLKNTWNLHCIEIFPFEKKCHPIFFSPSHSRPSIIVSPLASLFFSFSWFTFRCFALMIITSFQLTNLLLMCRVLCISMMLQMSVLVAFWLGWNLAVRDVSVLMKWEVVLLVDGARQLRKNWISWRETRLARAHAICKSSGWWRLWEWRPGSHFLF